MSKNQMPIIVFADGACSGNPGPGGWGAVIVVPEAGRVRELGGGERGTTNNRMEIRATIEALRALRDTTGEVRVYTDSTYVIRGITQWIWAWRRKGWKTAEGKEVTNQDLWERLFAEVAARKDKGKIEWAYVRGHSGVPGNERVDELAVEFTQGRRPELYVGPLLRYDVPVLDLPEPEELPERSAVKGAKKEPAYSYLSLVNGICRRHPSWPDCEREVKGRSGAKFKKAATAADEARILADWGVQVREGGPKTP